MARSITDIGLCVPNVETMSVLGFEVLTAVVMKNSIFRDITPCSPLKVNRRFGETCLIHLVSCLAYSSSMKMKETYPSETSVDFQQNTRHYIPEDRIFHRVYCFSCGLFSALHIFVLCETDITIVKVGKTWKRQRSHGIHVKLPWIGVVFIGRNNRPL
jgi:hypothetical protein